MGQRHGGTGREAAAPQLPDRLAGRYALGGLIDGDAASTVWRAHDRLLDRPAAVKVVTAAAGTRPESAVAALASLDHPHLVPIYDVGVADDVPDGAGPDVVLVTVLCAGGNLADRLAAGPLDVVDALVATAAVADALDHAHRAGVAHGAVSPRHVLFDVDGRAQLADTGVALVTGRPEPGAAADVADVHALGLVLLGALTGRTDPDPASLTAVPDGARPLVAAMLAGDPASRPSAAAVTVGLRRAALAAESGGGGAESGGAEPGGAEHAGAEPGRATPAPRQATAARRVVVAGGLALSAVLAGAAVFASTRPVEPVSAATTPPGAGVAVVAAPAPAPPAQQLPVVAPAQPRGSASDDIASVRWARSGAEDPVSPPPAPPPATDSPTRAPTTDASSAPPGTADASRSGSTVTATSGSSTSGSSTSGSSTSGSSTSGSSTSGSSTSGSTVRPAATSGSGSSAGGTPTSTGNDSGPERGDAARGRDGADGGPSR